MTRDREIGLDAIEACTLILEFSQGLDQADFVRDHFSQPKLSITTVIQFSAYAVVIYNG